MTLRRYFMLLATVFTAVTVGLFVILALRARDDHELATVVVVTGINAAAAVYCALNARRY